jgi:tetratricopeptide (TPR) repeat protein
MEAITWFARALGAARIGDVAAGEAALERLAVLREAAAENSTYWATQVDIQRTAAAAWLAYAAGDETRALETMRKAAQLEAATEKHPVTPGEVLPAAELLGDLLLELGRPADALAAYEQSLARSPNRYHSLSGAAQAAKQAGDLAAAVRYERELVALTDSGA